MMTLSPCSPIVRTRTMETYTVSHNDDLIITPTILETENPDKGEQYDATGHGPAAAGSNFGESPPKSA